MSLRDELERIAKDAPVVQPRADTWVRAQRARRQARLAVAGGLAGASAVVALMVALAVGLLPLPGDRVDPAGPTGADADLAVPDRIHAAPARVAAREDDGSWMRDEVSGDLAIGPAAAAYVMPEGLPVVVDAESGAHHLLDLPGFLGNDRLVSTATGIALSVSPDGRLLAYGYADVGPESVSEPVPSGIRVADFETGEVRELPLPGAEGTAVTDLSWSPDGSWLAWAGERHAEWTPSSIGGSSPVAGRIDVVAGQLDEAPREALRGGDLSVAVDDRGVVTIVAGIRMSRWDGREIEVPDVGGQPAGPPAVSPMGDVVLGSAGSPGAQDSGSVRFVDSSSGTVEERVVAPSALTTGAAVPLGWVDDDLALVQWVPSLAGDDGGLVLVGRSTPPRRVAVVERGADDSLSVAIGLMTEERPTVDRPAPDFAWSPEQQVWLFVGVVAGTTVLGVLLWERRRRTGLGADPRMRRRGAPRDPWLPGPLR